MTEKEGTLIVTEKVEQAMAKHSKAIVKLAEKLPKRTGNKHYKVGRSLEYAVKKALEQDGYTVFRSAGSHSQADLIAIRVGMVECSEGSEPMTFVTLVQCKRHRNLMTVREINTFKEFCKELSCNGAIAWRDKGIHIQDIVIK